MASSSSQAYKYDVFLSFRGTDMRKGFTSHLYEALRLRGINTFIDKELERGEKIFLSLFQAIESSRLSVIVFSQNFASSTFCLDELVRIVECKESRGQSVLPIFYKVDPREIELARGSFGKAFAQHEAKFNRVKDKQEKWKSALEKVASFAGWHITDDRDAVNSIERIVLMISNKLNEEKKRRKLRELQAREANFREEVKQKADKIPEHALKVIEEEITKLQLLELKPSEFESTFEYLIWSIELPWGNCSKENYDVFWARYLLDRDHYELAKVKRGILELIARGQFRGTLQGEVICLCGPPGVGKKSIARSMAHLLNKNLIEWSMWESSNVAEIKGYQRSCVGARPGEIVKRLCNVGTANPLILINDIDKLGKRGAGDVAKALLELFDSNQNASFLDCYLGFPIDLSKVLFVFTANAIDNIPKSLLDKMKVISIAGYVTQEKVHIVRDFLEKQIQEVCQLKPEQVEITNQALLSLIENYCPEAGVQILLGHIEKIYSKAILEIMEGASKVLVDESDLVNFVGHPNYCAERIVCETGIGVAMGLGLSEIGGSLFYIETLKGEQGGNKGLHVVGQPSQVMEHTAEIAYIAAASVLEKKEPGNHFFANYEVRLRILAGIALPKDCPSACGAMVTALLSLAMEKPVRNDLAITGEVTISGIVCPIDGIEERTIAARRNKVKKIIFPLQNKCDFDMLPPIVREGVEVQFVDDYEEIFNQAFNSSCDDEPITV